MLQIIAGYDPADPITAASIGNVPDYLSYLDPTALDGARIGLLMDVVGTEERHAEVNAVLEAAIATMESIGAEVIEITIPNFAELTSGMGTSGAEFGGLFQAYLDALPPEAPIRSIQALLDDGGYLEANAESLREGLDAAAALLDPDYIAVFQRRDAFQRALYVAMAENDIDAILYPHQRVLVAPIADGGQPERNGIVSNASGFPAVTFPGGFSTPSETAPIGVPVGIELLGRPWSEGTLLGFAYAFEQAADPRLPPESTPPLAAAP